MSYTKIPSNTKCRSIMISFPTKDHRFLKSREDEYIFFRINRARPNKYNSLSQARPHDYRRNKIAHSIPRTPHINQNPKLRQYEIDTSAVRTVSNVGSRIRSGHLQKLPIPEQKGRLQFENFHHFSGLPLPSLSFP